MKSGEIYLEKSYEGSDRVLKIKLIEYLGYDLWRVHCRNAREGSIKYYYTNITGEDIIEYYYKIEEAS